MDAIKNMDADDIVAYHIADGVYTTQDMKYRIYYVNTLQGERLKINGLGIAYPKIGSRHMSTSVNTSENYEASLFVGDIMCSNGVFHVISNFLVPESATSTAI